MTDCRRCRWTVRIRKDRTGISGRPDRQMTATPHAPHILHNQYSRVYTAQSSIRPAPASSTASRPWTGPAEPTPPAPICHSLSTIFPYPRDGASFEFGFFPCCTSDRSTRTPSMARSPDEQKKRNTKNLSEAKNSCEIESFHFGPEAIKTREHGEKERDRARAREGEGR